MRDLVRQLHHNIVWYYDNIMETDFRMKTISFQGRHTAAYSQSRKWLIQHYNI